MDNIYKKKVKNYCLRKLIGKGSFGESLFLPNIEFISLACLQ